MMYMTTGSDVHVRECRSPQPPGSRWPVGGDLSRDPADELLDLAMDSISTIF